MRWTAAVLTSVVAVTSACAPKVQVTELNGTFEARRSPTDVAVFTTQAPDCPYQEVAIVTAYQGDFPAFSDLDDVLAAVRERAHEIGADAVVGVRLVNRGGDSAREGYSGTGVRFEDADCMH
jgi:hypothetical protein